MSISSYFIGLGAGQLFYGPMLDRFGRKKPLYAGLLLFIFASIGCLESRTVEALIALRLLQALGGCVAQVDAIAMVRDFFPVADSSRIISMLILILGVSPLLAPTVGSIVATTLGWHWIFLILAIIVVGIMFVVFRYLPEGHQPDPTISFRPQRIIAGFLAIFANAQFRTYALAGALSFCSLFVYLSCVGITYPNAAALAMAPFSSNAGSAAALLGALQLGIGAAVSSGVGLLNSKDSVPIVSLMCGTTLIGLAIFVLGKRGVERQRHELA
jgi:DHA1 family bicyclomycin/chloramphenicol resistance-like MFS transporter